MNIKKEQASESGDSLDNMQSLSFSSDSDFESGKREQKISKKNIKREEQPIRKRKKAKK